MERVTDKVEKEKRENGWGGGRRMLESGKKTAGPLRGLFGV